MLAGLALAIVDAEAVLEEADAAVVVHAAANWLLVRRQIRLAEAAAGAVVP